MPGPERKSQALKVIAGTDRPDRNRSPETPKEVEFDQVSSLPRAPSYLNRYGREMWKTLGSQLVRCGVLQTPDLYAFEQLCLMWQGIKTRAQLGEQIPIRDHAMLNSLFVQFGVNPAARRRVARYLTEQPIKPAPQPQNPFAKHAKP